MGKLREKLHTATAALRTRKFPRVLAWVSLPFFCALCLLLMDYMNFSGHLTPLRAFWQNFPGAVCFEIVVIALLGHVLLFLCRRVWLSAAILGLTSIICSYVNFTKVALNGDYFVPQDIVMVTHAGELSQFLSGKLPPLFWVFSLILLLLVVFYALTDIRLPLRWFIRLPAAVLIAALAWLPCSNIDRADVMLSKFNMSVFDSALQSSNYTANGFVGAFTINCLSLNVQEPAGYDADTVQSMLADYEAVPADKDAEQFDVIVILSESFFDARILPGTTFSQNPLPNYDRLLRSSRTISGSLYTTAIGGGTVRPEFGVLTGLTCDYIPSVPTPYRYVSQPISTYVSNYKDAGYTTVAMHPYNKHFYSRSSAYGNIGFDQFWGQDEIAGTIYAEYKRGFVTDESTFRAITHCADNTEDPLFLFAITMQNHQPYDGIDPSLIQIEVENDRLSPPALTALTTYTQGLYDADKMLGDLAKWIDNRERPTVLVFFGDHMPTLGSNYLAYNESGLFNSYDGLDDDELARMYSTPFLIYSNRKLDTGLMPGRKNNHISDYNLMNSVALSTGMARTPYMELLRDFHSVTPIYNVRLGMELTEDIAPFAKSMEYITYDRVFGKNYTG
ncbi:MAG: sulfatase-like hydrolase/transferase [Oscillospiraceae bacterium]|nr:sulfatase-like hydrolase/transferase [Oscillospiraceae bacterium]